MATHGIGQGKVNITVTVPKWLDEKIRQLAHESEMSRNKYVRSLLEHAISEGYIVKQHCYVLRNGTSEKRAAESREKYTTNANGETS